MEEEEEDSGNDMASSPPPAGFSDTNKKWLKPVKKKEREGEAGRKLSSQRKDLLNGSGGDSDQESGEKHFMAKICQNI